MPRDSAFFSSVSVNCRRCEGRPARGLDGRQGGRKHGVAEHDGAAQHLD